MAEIKKFTWLLVATVFVVSTASALTLSVEIAELADHDDIDLRYQEEVSYLQEIKFTVENTGSLGCNYQAKAVHEGQDFVSEDWSNSVPMFPGDSREMVIRSVFENYTGEVETDVQLQYCGEERHVEQFSFEVDAEEIDSQDAFDTRAVEVNETGSIAITSLEDGILVPKEAPSLWRPSSAQIENKRVNLRYNPPIFQEREIEYHVIQDEEVIGTTRVNLSEPDNIRASLQRFVDRLRLKL